MKILNVVGARPNFMKIAPLMEAYASHPEIEPLLVHTGQHYDAKMSDLFFEQLGIPEPDMNLGVGSGSHAVQTADVMKAFEPIVMDLHPDWVVVVGDVNSTIACGLVAVKLGVKLAHVEAGLRSFDRTMPEEINRILTDSISNLLFCTEQSGVDNLRAEGVDDAKVHLVGNVMIDTLLRHREQARSSTVVEDMGLDPKRYAVLTLHRPANVDVPLVLEGILDALDTIQKEMPILFPIHPRTRKNIEAFGFRKRVEKMKGLRLIEPMGYLDFLKLMSEAGLVLTDSGGIQEETTILKVPCLTLRENTERPVTSEIGSNQIVGTQPQAILDAYARIREGRWRTPQVPPLWDGQAAQRIAEILVRLPHSSF
jgi:UDP-N-acetylglucosamine 2-epimerase (non-hydrolysing)